jgi:hypothetical protein
MTATVAIYEDHKTKPNRPYCVRVRVGCRIDIHRFARIAEAQAFAATSPTIGRTR